MVAEFAARWRDLSLQQWARGQWDPSAWPALREMLGSLPADDKVGAGQLVPPPWPDELVSAILESTNSPTLTDAQRLDAADGGGCCSARRTV